jgi:hypothetical protein
MRASSVVFGILVALAIGGPASAAGAGGAGFTVNVTLSPRAADRLARLGESIELSAYWYGEATKAAKKRADEMGQIYFGQEKRLLPGSGGTVVFDGASFDAKKLPWVVGGKAMMNLNVFTARKKHPDNLLTCDLFDDDMALAVAQPIAIHCKLIEEH